MGNNPDLISLILAITITDKFVSTNDLVIQEFTTDVWAELF